MDATRVAPPPDPPSLALEPLVLLVHTLARERAPALLEGLASPQAAAARVLLASVQALGSAQRQGRMARTFGSALDAPERLRGLVHEASPALVRELLARLPPYHRALFPARAPAPAAVPVAPLLARLAARLVLEASRAPGRDADRPAPRTA